MLCLFKFYIFIYLCLYIFISICIWTKERGKKEGKKGGRKGMKTRLQQHFFSQDKAHIRFSLLWGQERIVKYLLCCKVNFRCKKSEPFLYLNYSHFLFEPGGSSPVQKSIRVDLSLLLFLTFPEFCSCVMLCWGWAVGRRCMIGLCRHDS